MSVAGTACGACGACPIDCWDDNECECGCGCGCGCGRRRICGVEGFLPSNWVGNAVADGAGTGAGIGAPAGLDEEVGGHASCCGGEITDVYSGADVRVVA